jgi:hypothetical protein
MRKSALPDGPRDREFATDLLSLFELRFSRNDPNAFITTHQQASLDMRYPLTQEDGSIRDLKVV